MAEEPDNRPIVKRALHDLYRSYTMFGGAIDPDILLLAERTAQILHTHLDRPEKQKENLKAAGVLAYLGTDPQACGIRGYDASVMGIVADIQSGIDPGLCGGATKEVLQVCTAMRIAEYEQKLADLCKGEWNVEYMRDVRGDLRSDRFRHDRSAFVDIGADRLQGLELETWRRLADELDDRLRPAGYALPLTPGARLAN